MNYSNIFILAAAFLTLTATTTAQQVHILDAHTSSVFTARFSPDGSMVATGGNDNTTYVWSASNGTQQHKLVGHTGYIDYVEFSPDGALLLTASGDASIGLWESETGNLLTTLYGHMASVTMASFSPNGRSIVSASDDNTAKLWDIQQRELIATLQGHTARVLKAVFSKDNSKVATAATDGTAKLWDATSGALITTITPTPMGLFDAVYNVEFSPDGTLLLTSQSGDSCSVWDIASSSLRYSVQGRLARFSPDGASVVVVSAKRMTAYQATTGAELYSTQRQDSTAIPLGIFFPPATDPIMTATSPTNAQTWLVHVVDIKSGAVRHTLTGHTQNVNSTDISPNGRNIVTASNDGTARLWLDGATSHVPNSETPPAWRTSYIPASHSIRTSFSSVGMQPLTIVVYSLSGGKIASVFHGTAPVGESVFHTPLPALSSGMYYVVVQTQQGTSSYPLQIAR